MEVKDTDEDEYDEQDDQSDSSSDDGLVMMKSSSKKKPLSRTNSKTNLADNKTIERMEPTTLKYRTDSPDVPDTTTSHSVGTSIYSRKGNISPSPSQETLRPSNPSRNFLLAEEDDDDDLSWEPSSAFPRRKSLDSSDRNADEQDGYGADFLDGSPGNSGMRRTESGMLMPYDDDEDAKNTGIFGRVVDTVNTARDIAHVICMY